MKKISALFLTGVLAAGTVITSFAFDNIERGDKGDRVKEIQELLISSGYLSEEADGLFGKTTETAVLKYQEEHHLDATGIVGEATYELLKEDAEESVTEGIEEDTEDLTEASSEENVTEDSTETLSEEDTEEDPEEAAEEEATEELTEEALEEEMTEEAGAEWIWSSDTDILDGFEVKARLFDDIGGTFYYVAVKNNSTKTSELTGKAFAYDADNNLMSYSDLEINKLSTGEMTLGNFFFENVSDIDHVEYSLKAKPLGYYSSRLKNLSPALTQNDSNIIIQVTNNGTKPVSFLEGYILFLDSEDNIIEIGTDFIIDSDYELKPGDTQYAQITYYSDEPYDHYEFYLL